MSIGGGLTAHRPQLMGIINVTPDSFSDGGLHATTAAAIAHGFRLAEQGADILDIGGESTRPGAVAISEAEEIARVVPVVQALAEAGHRISIDTRKAAVMAAAVAAGASMINDVSALSFDPASLAMAVRLQRPVILMHAQGTPQTMQMEPHYGDVVQEVYSYLEARIEACLAAGLPRSLLLADPGIGFGKTGKHNLELLHHLGRFRDLGVPVVVGLSRKAFIGALTGEPRAAERVHGSVGGAIIAMLNGAQILRVHDMRATRQALAVALAVIDPQANGL